MGFKRFLHYLAAVPSPETMCLYGFLNYLVAASSPEALLLLYGFLYYLAAVPSPPDPSVFPLVSPLQYLAAAPSPETLLFFHWFLHFPATAPSRDPSVFLQVSVGKGLQARTCKQAPGGKGSGTMALITREGKQAGGEEPYGLLRYLAFAPLP